MFGITLKNRCFDHYLHYSVLSDDHLLEIHNQVFPERKKSTQNLKVITNKENFGIDFTKCIENKKIEDYILEDRIEGERKFKIDSTPTLIINNKKFDKPLTYKNIKKAIEKLI